MTVRESLAERLSPREREIALLVAQGMTNNQIAEVLGCTPNTVRTHLRMAFTEAGVRNRVSLAVLVADHRSEFAVAAGDSPRP